MAVNPQTQQSTSSPATAPSLLTATERAVSVALAAACTRAAAIEAVTVTFCTHLHWPWGAYWHFDRRHGLLQRQAMHCTPALAGAALSQQSVLIAPEYPQEDACTRALQSVEACLIGLPDHAATCRAVAADAAGMRWLLLVPVAVNGTCCGLLEFCGGAVTQDHAPLLDTLAAVSAQLGRALERTDAAAQRDRTAGYLESIATRLPAALFSLEIAADQAWRMLYVSDPLQTLCGVSAAEAIARPERLLELVCIEHREALSRSFAVAQEQFTGWDAEFEIMARNADSRRWLRAHALPHRVGDGIRWDGMLTDITDARNSEAAAAKAALDLADSLALGAREHQHILEELDAFAHSVSHDLRAPLRAINSFSKILLSEHGGTVSGAAQADLQRVQSASERMGNLIDALLDLSRITRQNLMLEAVDLSGLAAQAASELQEAQPREGARMQIQPGVTAQADPELMRLLLENLLDNAWKFSRTRAEAQIAFGTLTQHGELVYYVRDNGVGFSEKFADRLFEPFQRLHDDSGFEGMGTGLAKAKRIVRRHGGRIWAESRSGRGATFYFTLAQKNRS